MPLVSRVRQMSPSVSTHQPQPPASFVPLVLSVNSSLSKRPSPFASRQIQSPPGGAFGTFATARSRPAMKPEGIAVSPSCCAIEAIDLQMVRIHVRQIQERAALQLAGDRQARILIGVKDRIVRILEAVRQEARVFPVLPGGLRQIEFEALVAGIDAVRPRRIDPRAVDEQQPLHLPVLLAVGRIALERRAEARADRLVARTDAVGRHIDVAARIHADAGQSVETLRSRLARRRR